MTQVTGPEQGTGAAPDAGRPLAVVTGASSGIGAATVRALVAAGLDVIAAARRLDRLRELADELTTDGGPVVTPYRLDVTDAAAIDALAATVSRCAVVVCNAGGALGLDPVAGLVESDWRRMWETNVLGVGLTVRALLPALVASGDGRIVIVTSVAGHQAYRYGGGYTAAKHGAAVIADTLRLELLGQPVRIIEVAPGMVDTEFSTVRFDGDAERAAAVYAGMTPLSAADVADAISWAVTRPPHVVAARIDLFPREQASATAVHRGG